MPRKKKAKAIDMHLTEEEALVIRLTEKDLELIHKEDEVLKYKRDIISLNNKNAELEWMLQSQSNRERLNCCIKSQQNKLKAMATSRGIDGRWSYNPETREIVKED